MKNGIIPVQLGNFFEIRNANTTHRYSLRPRVGRVESINFRTRYGERSIQYRGSILWNDIPENIRACGTFKMFKKKKFKLHLLQHQIDDLT